MAELVYPPVSAFVKSVYRYLGLRLQLIGTEHVPRYGGAVMCLNHVGYLDFSFGGYAALPSGRYVRFMAKEAVFRHPVSGPLMRGMKHIPVDRDAGSTSFATALRALREGEIVGVFPEATISRSFELKEFKSGAVRLAQQSGTPVLPTVVWGSQRIWTKGRPKQLRRNHIPVTIAVGQPVTITADADAVVALAGVKARMAVLLADVQHAYPEAPRGEHDSWWLPARLGGTAPTLPQATEMDREDARRRQAQQE
ncbi:MAG: 1-acyl-sn-glycerol-3-phosphate acyltransferase [Pseudonocardiaceae bacterium]|nr:1-acyl-sn-glycerol-3-phosphate acyltransferase [Pseudonocardiaceae bacterium]